MQEAKHGQKLSLLNPNVIHSIGQTAPLGPSLQE